MAVAPISEAAIGLRSVNTSIEFPEELSGGGVEREDFLRGRDSIQNAIHHDRTSLQSSFLSRVESPRDLKILDVAAVDLR